MITDYTVVKEQNAALRNENAVLKEELTLVQQQMTWLKKQMFGRKTERSSVIMDGGTQLPLFPDEAMQSAPKPEKTITVPEHQRKSKCTHDDWMSSLPVEEVLHKKEHPVP